MVVKEMIAKEMIVKEMIAKEMIVKEMIVKEMIATNSQGAALQKANQQMRAGVGKIKTETS